jgi:large subunit ribosomal protein L21
MYAVIGTGGKQYKVVLGRRYCIDYLEVKVGDQVTFDQVYLIIGGDQATIGQPLCQGKVVKASVVTQGKGKKINILHFKRRKHHLKRKGHRQLFTQVQITEIPGQKMPELPKKEQKGSEASKSKDSLQPKGADGEPKQGVSAASVKQVKPVVQKKSVVSKKDAESTKSSGAVKKPASGAKKKAAPVKKAGTAVKKKVESKKK